MRNVIACMNLDQATEKNGTGSSLGPFRVLRGFRAVYPTAVIEALGDLYQEYNRAFGPLVAANRECPDDYAACRAKDGSPVNYGVQIDMAGLDDELIGELEGLSTGRVKEVLRRRIFEIENSLAMYPVLQDLFSFDGEGSFFRRRFRGMLDRVREAHGRPIALLAVTDEKYEAMMATEFGKRTDEGITDGEVSALSGFDRFFSPAQFAEYARTQGAENGGYLLYVRASEPIAKLKKPETVVHHPLLGDPGMRRFIKENSLTFNIDDPEWNRGDRRRINDTKRYMPAMDMAFEIGTDADLHSEACAEFLSRAGKDVTGASGTVHCKPAQGTYGCYGHVFGRMDDGDFLGQVRRRIRLYGPLMVQPQMPNARAVSADGREFAFIDRNFFSFAGGRPEFLGGFRDFMPADSFEARNFRLHGSRDSLWGEITA